MPITATSLKRAENWFCDVFLQSRYLDSWQESKDNDFFNEPNRASRVYEYAKDGCDGRTHAEVIEDWREALEGYMRDRRKWSMPYRFMQAVEQHIDSVEEWHAVHGTLHQVIG